MKKALQMDKIEYEATLTKCPRDCHSKHFWERVGVWGKDYILYKCLQCNLSKLIKIRFVDGGCVEK
jgi:hypothetical protein